MLISRTRYGRRAAATAILVALVAQSSAFADTPASWQVHFANGEQALKLQELPEAETCFRQALKDVKHKGNPPDDVARCTQALAGTLQLQELTEEALSLYRKALHIETRAHGRDSRELVPILMALGTIYETEGTYHGAIKFYERALAISEKVDGPQNLSCALCQHRLGRVLFKAGAARRAENLYLIALTNMMQQTSLPSAQPLEDLLADYVDLLRKSERTAVASSKFQNELLKDRLSSVERTQGVSASEWGKEVSGRLAGKPGLTPDEQKLIPREFSQSPNHVPPRLLDKPVTDFAALDDLSRQRILFYERMVAVDIDSLGAEHPSVARDLSGLASIYLLHSKFAEAKPLLTRALNIYKSNYGPDSMLVKRTQSLLELINDEKKSVEEGGPSGRDYVAGLPHIPLVAEKIEIALQLNYLALLCSSKGRIDDACKIYAWALADTADACGEQSMLVSACLMDYGRTLSNLGRQSEADKLENDAQVILRRGLYRQEAFASPQIR